MCNKIWAVGEKTVLYVLHAYTVQKSNAFLLKYQLKGYRSHKLLQFRYFLVTVFLSRLSISLAPVARRGIPQSAPVFLRVDYLQGTVLCHVGEKVFVNYSATTGNSVEFGIAIVCSPSRLTVPYNAQ